MKSAQIMTRMANSCISDIDHVWKELSGAVKTGSGAHAFRYVRQHGSRAARWLPYAIARGNGISTESHQLTNVSRMPLCGIVRLDPHTVGARARAAFLEVVHRIPAETAGAGTLILPNDVRKTANNVAESVRRSIRFFRAIAPDADLPEHTLWPEPPTGAKLDRGIRLYRDIRQAHIRQGVLNPADHVPAITQRVALEHAERGRRSGTYGGYNLMVRTLRTILSDGKLPGVPPTLADGLTEMRMNPSVGPHCIMPLHELASRWPEHFKLTENGEIDQEYGLLGFFNRDIGLRRPCAPSGASCPSENLLGKLARDNRLGCLRRFLARVATPADVELANCFREDRVWKWLTEYIGERDEVSSMHLQAWWSVRYTARIYMGIDTTWIDRQVEEGIQFPDSGSSLKGTRTVEKAGPNPAATLLAQAAALHTAAEAEEKPTPSHRSGLYLARKSVEVEFWIRLLTGLRPSNVEELEVLQTPTPETRIPAIWREETSYVVCIPYGCMKQNKRRSRGRPIVSRVPKPQRPYVFRIEYAAAVSALDEYLQTARCHAVGVYTGLTRRLLINARGGPFKSFEASQRKARKTATNEFDQPGVTMPDLDRYATRHIMAELLRAYMPEGRLHTLYLTHRSEHNADKHYGSDDHAFLRQCIHEILDGKPPLPEQRRQQAEQLQRQEAERHRIVEGIAGRLTDTTAELKKLTAALEAKEAEIRRLRGTIATARDSRKSRTNHLAR